MPDTNHRPCRPWCKQLLDQVLKLEIKRIESILDEREKATILLANTEVSRRTTEMMEKYVEKESHEREIKQLQGQISGPLGLELRMRALEQARGTLDAKLYMILVGIPIAISGIMYVIMKHVFGN